MSAPPAIAPWDGCYRVKKPDGYTPGLYRPHQIDALDLLRTARGLTEWDATLLQVVAYQERDLSGLQRFWLTRLVREHGEAVSA